MDDIHSSVVLETRASTGNNRNTFNWFFFYPTCCHAPLTVLYAGLVLYCDKTVSWGGPAKMTLQTFDHVRLYQCSDSSRLRIS